MRTVSEVMTEHVTTVTTSDVVGPLRDAMLDGRLHGVPVLDAHGKLAGIVTGSDLVEEWAPDQGVVTVMSSEVHTVSPHASVVDAAREMLTHRIHHLVVTERDRIVGVVSSFDLLHELAGEVEAAAAATEVPSGPTHATAEPGDVVVIRGHAIDRKERRGVIVEVRGADGGPPFVVRWLDDPHGEPHDVLFFPGSDADVEHPEG
jgi:CBS domain containing-hemolysin-like protein